MNPQDTIDLSREAIVMAASVAGPMLIAGLLIGLVIGVLQAMTQIQDQTVSAVPKIAGMLLVGLLALPWISDRMVDYTRQTLSRPLVGGQTTAFLPPTFQTRGGSATRSDQATIPQSTTLQQTNERPARFAARPMFAPVFPTAPKLIPATYPAPRPLGPAGLGGGLNTSAMPSMKFRNSAMPQMLLPAAVEDTEAPALMRLPTFQRTLNQQLPRTDIGG